jgi:hypothetical protein
VNGNNNYQKSPMNRNITSRARNQGVENDTNVMVSSPTTALCASNVPLFRANLVKCIINECVASFGLVDSGATYSAISLATFSRLRANEQCNNMYKVHDLKLAAVNGDELTIFGEVYIRVQVGKTLLRTRALVIKDLHHALILGNDVMKKYKFVISYDDDTLVIKKKTNLVTVQPTKIAPKTTMLIPVQPSVPLYAGLVGKVCKKPLLTKYGLNGFEAIETTRKDTKYLHIKIANPSNTTIKLRKHLCLAEFCAFDDISEQTKMENTQHLLTNQLAQKSRLEPSNPNLTYTHAHANFSHAHQPGHDSEQQMPIRQANFSAARCSHDREVNSFTPRVNKNQSEARNVLRPVINETPYTLPKTTQRAFDALNETNSMSTLQVDLSESILDENQKQELVNLINKNNNVFAKHALDVGCVKGIKHVIKLVPNTPDIKSYAYRTNPKQREIISLQINDWLKAGIIEPSDSNFSSPCILVPKKSEPEIGKPINPMDSNRLVIDFRNLNKYTIKDNHPMPLISDLIDAIGPNKKYFTTLDCISGYLQIQMDENSKKFTAFATHDGLYQFRRLPYGLINSPSTFVRCVMNIFRDLLYKNLVTYMDDILLYTETYEDHIKLLKEVFHRLEKAGLKLKLNKCKFARKSVRYLGFILSEKGIQPDPDKLKVVENYPVPKTATEIKSFTGLTSYYRRLIPNYSVYAKPLTQLIRKNAKFVWTEAQQKGFEALKNALISAPVVSFPDYNKPFIVYTDASKISLSAILCQIQDGEEKVIAYAARQLKPAETKYHIIRLELAAIVMALTKWRCFCQYCETTVYTDCKPLVSIIHKNEPPEELKTAVYFLSHYPVKVEHRPGKSNRADGLSRVEHPHATEKDSINDLPFLPFITAMTNNNDNESDFDTDENDTDSEFEDAMQLPDMILDQIAEQAEITASEPTTTKQFFHKTDFKELPYGEILDLDMVKYEQQMDQDLCPIMDYLAFDILPDDSKLASKIAIVAEHYALIDDLLYHHSSNRNKGFVDQHLQLVIPKNLRLPVLTAVHDKLSHRGIPACYNTLKVNYFWNNMYADLTNYVRSCVKCNEHKPCAKDNRPPLQPLPVATAPFQSYAIDLAVKMNETPNGNKHIVAIVDTFTKYVQFIPTKNIEASTVAQVLYENVICRFGCFKTLVSDRGTQFISELFQHLIKLCGASSIISTSYHHQTAGAIEIQIKYMKSMIAKCANETCTNWDTLLPAIVFSKNITINETTGTSPFYITHMRQPTIELDIALPKPTDVTRNVKLEIEDMSHKVELLDKLIRENIMEAQSVMSKQYNKRCNDILYAPGMHVWLYVHKLANQYASKFSKHYIGPFVVTRKDEFNNVFLKDLKTSIELTLPIPPARLMPCVHRKIPPVNPPAQPALMTDTFEKQLNTELQNLTKQHDTEQTVTQTNIHTDVNQTTHAPQETTAIQPQTQQTTFTTQETTTTPPRPLTARDSDNTIHPKLRGIKPPNYDDALLCPPDRQVHAIPKAFTMDNETSYYIIYEDQIDKNVGKYVNEKDLTHTEREFVFFQQRFY